MIRGLPVVALSIGALLLAVGLAMQALTPAEHARWVARLGFDLDALYRFRLWTMPFATVVQSDPGLGLDFWALLCSCVAAVALVERSAGWKFALAAFFMTDWLASFLRLAALATLAGLGSSDARRFLDVADTGSSAALAGVLTVAALLHHGRTRALLLALLALWLGYGVSRFRLDIGIVHAAGALAGVLLTLLWRRATDSSASASTAV